MTPERMATLHATGFHRGWSHDEIMALLAKPTTRAVTAPHGFALIQVVAPEAEVLTLVVDRAHRGQGHGRALLRQTLQTAATNGAETLLLEVDASNTAALALYTAAGFARTGTRPTYYTAPDGSRGAAILMARATQSGT